MFVRDSLAFVVTGGWLDVISLVNTSDPELVGVFNMPANAFGVWVRNDLVYVTKCTDHNINWFYDQEISGFEIIDTKYAPYILLRGSLDTPWV